VIEPGEEGAGAAQVAPQLVPDAVIAVIGAHALGGVATEGFAVEEARGEAA
jgi:hypothetical protein